MTGTEQSLGARTSPDAATAARCAGPTRRSASRVATGPTCITQFHGGRELHLHRLKVLAELATSEARSANSL